LSAQGRIVAAYRSKFGGSPFPPALLYAKGVAPEQIRASEVRRIDDDNAEVMATGLGRYRVARIDNQWTIQSTATVGLRYPADPIKAMQVLTAMFDDIIAMYDTATEEITSGKLANAEAVNTALTGRLARILLEDGAKLPQSAVALPLKVANNSFMNIKPADNDYQLGLDPNTKRLANSSAVGHIKSLTPAAAKAVWFSGIAERGELDAIRGKRVRFTGWIKTTNVTNWASLQLWAQAADGKGLAQDDMGDRPIHGTTDWQQYTIVADIPKQTSSITLAVSLMGPGELWCDDVQADVVASDVPTTDNQNWHMWSQTAPKYSAVVDPAVPHDGHPSLRIASTTAKRNEWGAYDHYDRVPDKYLGRRVRVTAWMKCQNVVKDAGLWIRILGPNDRYIAGEVTPARRQLKGTMDWQQYSIVADVPANAMAVGWGFVMDGTGNMWVDLENAKLELVEEPGKEGL
jgi:hypothetical protein